MTITEVSQKFGLTPDTLRYYERIGLIPAVHRAESGVRDYDQNDLNWVAFIKCMRGAGISIEALIDYVALFQQGDVTLGARRDLLIKQYEGLEQRIQEMQATLNRLKFKIQHYDKMIIGSCSSGCKDVSGVDRKPED